VVNGLRLFFLFFLRFVHDYHLLDVVAVTGVRCHIGHSTVLPFVSVFFSALISAWTRAHYEMLHFAILPTLPESRSKFKIVTKGSWKEIL